MGKVFVELDIKELERAAERLPTPVKIRLAQRWGRATGNSEWGRLFASIDRHRRGRRVPSMQEIVKEVKAVRRAQYERERSQRSR